MKKKENKLKEWVKLKLSTSTVDWHELAGDASARHYYRVKHQSQSYIAMWSPSPDEPLQPFIEIAKTWFSWGVPVPDVKFFDFEKGFALLEDIGQLDLLDLLDEQNVDDYYERAIELLYRIQVAPLPANYTYPLFDKKHILKELGYFKEWCLQNLLELKMDSEEAQVVDNLESYLIQIFEQQPQVVVHRDYHSRNLVLNQNDSLGVLDFQDAMIGPITYDLVSLLKDCYIQWPKEKVSYWLKNYYDQCLEKKSYDLPEFTSFKLWFDMVGLHRHLKVLGIFSRLSIRDQKPRYLEDIPRIISYILPVCADYPQLEPFYMWWTKQFIPRVETILQMPTQQRQG